MDSDYFENPDNDGHIFCALYNYGNEWQEVKIGEKIMQGIILPYYIHYGEELADNERTGGIGSTN